MTVDTGADPEGELNTQLAQEYTQARVRVNLQGAQLLWKLLMDEKDRAVFDRDEMTARGLPSDDQEQRLRRIQRLLQELGRAAGDRGWELRR